MATFMLVNPACFVSSTVHLSFWRSKQDVRSSGAKKEVNRSPERGSYGQARDRKTESAVLVNRARVQESYSPRLSNAEFSLGEASTSVLVLRVPADTSKHARRVNCGPKQPDLYKISHIPVEARASNQTVCGVSALQRYRRYRKQDRSLLKHSPVPSSSSKSKLRVYAPNNIPESSKTNRSSPSVSEADKLPDFTSTSSESVSRGDQVSKSFTMEDISLQTIVSETKCNVTRVNYLSNVGQVNERIKLKQASLESPQSGVSKGEIFELCSGDGNDDDVVDAVYNVNTCTALNSCSESNKGREDGTHDDPSSSGSTNKLSFNSLSDSSNHPQLRVDTPSQTASFSADTTACTFHVSSTDSTLYASSADSTTSTLYASSADSACDYTCSLEDSIAALHDNTNINNVSSDYKETITKVNIKTELNNNENLGCEANGSEQKPRDRKGQSGRKSRFHGLRKLFSIQQNNKEMRSELKSSDKEYKRGRSKSNKEKKSRNKAKESGRSKRSGTSMAKMEKSFTRRPKEDTDLVCEIWGVGKIDSP